MTWHEPVHAEVTQVRPAAAQRWAVIAATITGVLTGAAIVGTRVVVDAIGPATIGAVRYTIALLLLLPIVLAIRGSLAVQPRDRFAVLALGVLQFGVQIVLINVGLQSVASAPAALLFSSFPLITLLVAAWLGHEALSRRKVAAVALTMIGVALALGTAALEQTGGGIAGELAVLAAAATGAVCSVLYRPYVQRYGAMPLAIWAMGAAAAALAATAPLEQALPRLQALSASSWWALLFIGASSALGFVTWLWALGRMAASRVTMFVAFTPLTALALGTLLLGEPIPWRLAPALLLVLAGLWVARDRAA